MTLHVSLTPELERLVREKVASGLYGNASEVVREALRLLAERDRIRRTGATEGAPGEGNPGERTAAPPSPAAGEASLVAEDAGFSVLREALEHVRLGYRLIEQTLRREHPGASDREIAQRIADWQSASSWGEEAPGFLERSPERLARLRGDPD